MRGLASGESGRFLRMNEQSGVERLSLDILHLITYGANKLFHINALFAGRPG